MMLKSIELRIPPPLWWLVFAALAVWMSRWFPAWNTPFVGHQLLALVLAASGFASGLAGVAAFWRAQTTIDPHWPEQVSHLVRSGVYRFTRNPMYLGLLLVLLAIVAWRANPFGLLAAAGFVVCLNRFQIQPEERVLQARFGEEYGDWKRRVRRWL